MNTKDANIVKQEILDKETPVLSNGKHHVHIVPGKNGFALFIPALTSPLIKINGGIYIKNLGLGLQGKDLRALGVALIQASKRVDELNYQFACGLLNENSPILTTTIKQLIE